MSNWYENPVFSETIDLLITHCLDNFQQNLAKISLPQSDGFPVLIIHMRPESFPSQTQTDPAGLATQSFTFLQSISLHNIMAEKKY